MNNILAAILLSLTLSSGLAYADDNTLMDEANNAFAQKDYSTAFTKFSILANHGIATAQYFLGNLYLVGLGVKEDDKQAAFWLTKAAAQGNAGAKEQLTKMQKQASAASKDNKSSSDADEAYDNGDYKLAEKKYRKAATQGNVNAQNRLGIMYYNGQGVKKDYKQAATWFLRSALQGNAEGQYSLGALYDSGTGVKRNYVLAAAWYSKAAEQGFARAQDGLAALYFKGNGVKQDYAQAVAWGRKSAEQGDIDGQNDLGYAYANGLGVNQDYSQAAAWYRKAAAQGSANAQDHLVELEAKGKTREDVQNRLGEANSVVMQLESYPRGTECNALGQSMRSLLKNNENQLRQFDKTVAQMYQASPQNGEAFLKNNSLYPDFYIFAGDTLHEAMAHLVECQSGKR